MTLFTTIMVATPRVTLIMEAKAIYRVRKYRKQSNCRESLHECLLLPDFDGPGLARTDAVLVGKITLVDGEA